MNASTYPEGQVSGLGIPCLLQRASISYEHELAVISKYRQLTFDELEKKVQIIGRYFCDQGIQRNDRVIISLNNSVELVVTLLALMRIEAIPCPINPKFPTGLEERVTSLLDTSWFIGTHQRSSTAHYIDASSITAQLELEVPQDKSSPIYYSPTSPNSIVLTSGTSGTPKAAVFSYQQHYCSALGANDYIPLNIGDKSLLSLPMFHIGGIAIVFRCLLAGATIVIPDDNELTTNINRFHITHASMVNTQLKRLLRQDTTGTSLKHVLVGGGPVNQLLLTKAGALGINCYHTYGLTEMASQVFTHDQNGTGQTLPYRQLSIDIKGEIIVKGETLFLGYFEGGTTRLPLDAKGWFHTKDLGKLTGETLLVTGRKDNQFISGGENIQPEEVEGLINSLPGVNQSIVVPQKDSEYGLKPVVFIDAKPPITVNRLKQYLITQIPSFKIPRTVYPWVFTQELKPSRKGLKEQADIFREDYHGNSGTLAPDIDLRG